MERNIVIQIIDKVAYADKNASIVCNNKDYTATFIFDDEWAGIDTKTARFFANGKYTDVIFTGNTVKIPPIYRAAYVRIGVFAGDLTTTPATVKCEYSILCDGGTIEDPHPDVYAQIMDKLNDSSLFIVRETETGVADRTFDEVKAAFEAGKIVLFKDDTYGVFVCHGEGSTSNRPGERGYMFQSAIISGSKGHKLLMTSILYPPNVFEHLAEFPLTAVTEHELTIKTDSATYTYDGSEDVEIPIHSGDAERFIVHATLRRVGDTTETKLTKTESALDILHAYKEGKIVTMELMYYGVNIHLYYKKLYLDLTMVHTELSDTEKVFKLHFTGTACEKVYLNAYIDYDETRTSGLGIEYQVLKETTLTGMDEIPSYLPNPWSLIFEGGTFANYRGTEGDPTTVHIPHTWRELEGKPFGLVSEGGAVLPEIEISTSDTGYAAITNEFRLYAGETYIVTLNGVQYECVAKKLSDNFQGYVAIGDTTLSGNSEYPFVIGYHESGVIIRGLRWGVAGFFNNKGETVKLKIEGKRVVKPIPQELIQLSDTATGKAYRLSVTNGALGVEEIEDVNS